MASSPARNKISVSPSSLLSSSSPSMPSRPNPKLRNSETGDLMRRSFRGNPFPADSSRRNSIGRECSNRVEFGDKENQHDKDQISNVVKAPTKGSKHFMSPTISAVSKINPSPRKKILSDKNEVSRSFDKTHHQVQVKSSVSFSDVISIIGEDKDHEQTYIDEKKQLHEEESHDITVTDFDEIIENNSNDDSSFKISPLPPSVPYTFPVFESHEVDPSVAPYDPKKNYLSPRPQFLHYKPNPRIEKRFDECKQLEELFISESSSSETELSVEESEEQENDGAEVVVEDETKDVEQSEAESDEEMVCESVKETTTSPVPKQSGFRKFKFLGWFLALAMVYLFVSATFSPPMKSSFNEFHIPREITEFAKANNLDKLSEKLYTLTESSLVYMDKLISSLGGGNEEYGLLQFHNLTYTLEDNTVFQSTSVEINEEPLQEKSKVETNLEDVYIEDGSVNEFEEESGAEENSEVVCDAETNEFDEQAEVKPSTDIESNDGEGNLKALFEDGLELNIEELRESDMSPEENNDARGSEPERKLETESESIYINQHKESEVAVAESGSEEGFGETAAETSDDLHPKVRSSNKADNDSTKAVIVLSSTVLVLLAVTSFLFAKKTKQVAASAPKPSPETTMELNLGHVPVENLVEENLFSLNFEEEVDDRMSNSFHQSEGGKKNNKNSSSSKLRRESMASSASEYSVGSFSYGSFTTYEKIPIKSGDREEEMITPVRRSSRIRNKPSGGL